VMCTARLKAASRPGPGRCKPSRTEPYCRLLRAHGSGLRFSKPGAGAQAAAFSYIQIRYI